MPAASATSPPVAVRGTLAAMRTRRSAALVVVASVLSAPAGAVVVDRVVATVEAQLVLASEVEFEAVLVTLDASPSPFFDPTRGDPLERLVEAAVVREMAGDVAIYQPSDDEVAARVEAIRAKFAERAAWQAFLARWGHDEESLGALLRRRMVVERYLARNVQAKPDTAEAWWRGCRDLLDNVRPRYRIRYVRTQVPPP